ncbi:VOC family protein [Parashewanella curva]|uniref:VOC family protein n=1 Tax=Parashewanella curva TaxID=2338552 RepID=A0A3L8Q3A5_9GAMM|nr:VOC family protein [Parashewanella curva]RLV61669.1 VOC family protein [Parashewanella curva]
MIRLEHVNIVVRDLDETLAFYQAAFPHWKVRGGGENIRYGMASNWLHFGDDYHYLAFSDHGIEDGRDLKTSQIGLAHIAFTVSNLDALIIRLESAGYQIAINGAEDPSHKSVYFIDPNGIEVEFVEYLTDLPSERNRY